jgi:sugar O-acyltransferase (sialic acid O-acetyltransferase NeuD family)
VEDLIVLGAGGLGQEIVWLAEEINDAGPRWNIAGYLDDNPAAQGTSPLGYPVLGTLDDARRHPRARYFLGVGDPRLRQRMVERMRPLDLSWATLVSPTVRLHRSNKLGVGVGVGRYTDMTIDCEIDDFAYINIHVVLGHAVKVGQYSVVDPNVTINGEGVIGSVCLIGANAFVRDVKVGDGATIGAGSVVVKDVEPDCVVAGVPAKLIRMGSPRHTLSKSERSD